MNVYSPKKDAIRQKVIEELLLEGSKRPTQIKALKEYSSEQDKYRLLNELVNEGILQKQQFSHKNREYGLPPDKNLERLGRSFKDALQEHHNLEKEIAVQQLDKPKAVSLRFAVLLYQLANIFQAIEAIGHYRLYKPKSKSVLLELVKREIEYMLDILEAFDKNNPEATDSALKEVGRFLVERAERKERNLLNPHRLTERQHDI
jgi:hypothetical protein